LAQWVADPINEALSDANWQRMGPMRESVRTETSKRELWGTVVRLCRPYPYSQGVVIVKFDDGTEAEFWASRFPTTMLKERMRVKCLVQRTVETILSNYVEGIVERVDDEPAIAS
jgi:hypothetical protein